MIEIKLKSESEIINSLKKIKDEIILNKGTLLKYINTN